MFTVFVISVSGTNVFESKYDDLATLEIVSEHWKTQG
jgi:hypothetical protein